MVKSKLMLPILAVIVGVAASAFTAKSNNTNKSTGNYWYTFNGTQTVAGRQDKTQYVNPSTTEPSCSGLNNECSVEVKGITGTPPSDISSLDITFDSGTGMPDGGNNFQFNAQKH